VVLSVIYVDEVCHIAVQEAIVHVPQGPRQNTGQCDVYRRRMPVSQEIVYEARYDDDGKDQEYIGRGTVLKKAERSSVMRACMMERNDVASMERYPLYTINTLINQEEYDG
jgi:hypothetical protein